MDSKYLMQIQRLCAVIATKGRAEDIRPLLQSLRAQSRVPDQIVVVDQNADDRLVGVLSQFNDLPIQHRQVTDVRGVNASRNIGWQQCSADVLFFPDDDCWYPESTCEKALKLMEEHGVDIVSGRAADQQGNSINGKFLRNPALVDRQNTWFCQIEWMFFARRRVLIETGGFDEVIGPGANTRWGANEVQDLSLRAISLGYSQYYDPRLYGHHPKFPISSLDEGTKSRIAHYGRGLGYVLAKNDFSVWSALYWSARAVLSSVVSLLVGNVKKSTARWISARARLQGFREAKAAMKDNFE